VYVALFEYTEMIPYFSQDFKKNSGNPSIFIKFYQMRAATANAREIYVLRRWDSVDD